MKSVASSVSASARPLVRDFPSRSRHSHRTVDGKYSRGIGIVVKSVASSARLRPSLGPGLSHQEADTATGRLDNTGSVGAGWGCHEKCCLRLPASVRALGLGFPNEEEDAGTGRWGNMGSVGAGLECRVSWFLRVVMPSFRMVVLVSACFLNRFSASFCACFCVCFSAVFCAASFWFLRCHFESGLGNVEATFKFVSAIVSAFVSASASA